MQLGQLARERQTAILAEGGGEVAQCRAQLVRRFVEDHGTLLALERVQMLAPRLFIHGKKALEAPAPGRQTACGERADRSAAAGDRDDRNIVLGAQRDQILAGVGDGRRAGVGHERTGLAAEHPLEHDFTACAAVVFIIGDHRLAGKLTGGQQLLRNARVLGGDEVDRAEDLACTGRKIAQIADRGCD